MTLHNHISYKPTVYEQIVTDFWNGKELKYENYKKELSARGWKDKRYFDAYVEDLKFIRDLMKDGGFTEFADNILKEHFSDDRTKEIFASLKNIAEIKDEKQKNKSRKKLGCFER